MNLNSQLLGLHLAVVLFGATGLFGKFISASPVTIIAGRSVCTAVFMLFALLLFKRSFALGSRANALRLFFAGLVLSLHWFAFFHAIQISSVAIGVIGFATYPVFVTFLEPLLFSESYRRLDLVSGLLVFVGLLFLTPSFSWQDETTRALVWAVFSGLLLAIHTLMNRRLVKHNHFLAITFYQHAVASCLSLPLIIYFGFWPSNKELGLLVLLGLVFTAVPQALLVQSLSKVKAQVASVAVGLEPVYAVIFAVILLGEIPSFNTLIGGAVVGAAVVIAMISHARAERPAPVTDVVTGSHEKIKTRQSR